MKFKGLDRVSELYWYDIEFTSPVAGLPMEQVLGRPARFTIAPIDPNLGYLRKLVGENAEKFSKMPPAQTIHGLITQFDELDTGVDETRYRVRLEPKLADLNRARVSRLFQHQSMQLAAQKQLFMTAGRGLDIGVMKRITLAAGEALSFFAAKLGIRLFAAKGKVEIQAQSDAMALSAMAEMRVSSSEGEVIITGRQGVTLGDGAGAYIKLSGGKIVLGSPAGEIELKGNVTVNDPGGGRFTFPQWTEAPLQDIKQCANTDFSN